MKLVTEVNPIWGEYYIAIVSLFKGNPKHKVIIFVDDADDNGILYTALTYEDKTRYRSNTLPYFQLVEKLNITANEHVKE